MPSAVKLVSELRASTSRMRVRSRPTRRSPVTNISASTHPASDASPGSSPGKYFASLVRYRSIPGYLPGDNFADSKGTCPMRKYTPCISDENLAMARSEEHTSELQSLRH